MRKFLVWLLCAFLIVSCSSTPNTEEEIQKAYKAQVEKLYNIQYLHDQGVKKFDCFIEAYRQLGDKALPRPLPSREGDSGELVYDIRISAFSTVPMHVYSLSEVTYAPGEGLAQTLKDSGMLGQLVTPDSSTVKGLKDIEIIVFEGDRISSEEAARLDDRFGFSYHLVGTPEGESNIFQMLLLPFRADTEQVALEKYDAYRDLQRKHAPEILPNRLKNLVKGKEQAGKFNENRVCKKYAEDFWQARIDAESEYEAAGDMLIAPQGTWWRFTRPEWKEGEWGAIIMVSLDPEFRFN